MIIKQENETFNPALKAILSMRNIASNLMEKEGEIKNTDAVVRRLLDDVLRQASGDATLSNISVNTKKTIFQNFDSLLNIMDLIKTKFDKKDATGLTEIWEQYKKHVEDLRLKYEKIRTKGLEVLNGNAQEDWRNIWSQINNLTNKNVNIAEAMNIQLSMIEQLKPEEIDELTHDVLCHIPYNYNLEEAQQYEAEYLKAYEELKREASKKKNVWDKFMDILSGGIVETPAHRVQMLRWMDGEKIDA